MNFKTEIERTNETCKILDKENQNLYIELRKNKDKIKELSKEIESNAY